jgi:hypothetical protein
MKLVHFIFSVAILIVYFNSSLIISQDHFKKPCSQIYELKNESFKNKVFQESEKFLLEIISNSKQNCNLKLVFKNGISYISRKSDDSKIYLHFSKDKAETILESNIDLLYLFGSAGLVNDKITSLDLAKVNSLEDLLSVALIALGNKFKKIKSPNEDDWFGGNPNAENLFNSGSFNYSAIEQLHSDQMMK